MGETWHLSELETWALCQIGNNEGKSLNSPSYFYQREIQPGELGSLERSDFEEQQENSGKQGEEEDGMLESDSPNNDDDTFPGTRADFYLGRGSRFWRSIHFNSRIRYSWFFIYIFTFTILRAFPLYKAYMLGLGQFRKGS